VLVEGFVKQDGEDEEDEVLKDSLKTYFNARLETDGKYLSKNFVIFFSFFPDIMSKNFL